MAIGRPRRRVEQDPFTDLLFNVLIAFTLLFFIVVIFIHPPAKDGIIDPKAEFIITTKWEDLSPDDIDTWVEDPSGSLVWFRNTEVGFMHLDRDDRGVSNDTILVDGKEVINPLNQEVVTIRSFVPGEYVVNLHYYKTISGKPVNAEVRVVKVNPRLEVVYYGTLELNKVGAEKTAVRFYVTKQGQVKSVSTLQKNIVTIETK